MSLFGEAGDSTGLGRIVNRAMLVIGIDAEGQDALMGHYAAKAADYINGVRGFTPTDTYPVEAQYESTAVDMTIFAFNKRGAEGQTAHSENGVQRQYENGSDYPASLTSMIAPKVRVPAPPETEE